MTEPNIAALEKKVSTLMRLAEISASLNAEADLQALLNQIMATCVEITDSEAASVLLWDRQHNKLVFTASTTLNEDNELIGLAVPMDSIAGTIFTTNQPLQVDDARHDPRHYDKVDENISFVTRSLLGVPMTNKGQVIGVLEAINKRTLPWTAEDHLYMNILAAQAAVAIERAQFIQALERAYAELSELDKLKNDFIAIASHELRTPLGVIMGYASFLQDGHDPDTHEHATKVLESALKLRKIIEDMVNLRYLKQKQADLMMERLTLDDIMQGLSHETHASFDSTHHRLEIIVRDGQRHIDADYARLLMALSNLLNNAFTFTPQGGLVRVTCQCADEREAHIVVSDTGIGIEAHQLERIFEEFYQVEDHMTRRHGGLGIGLSIARAIVNAHGGRIWAESDGLGRGARFTIALPLTRD
ncbi:MAG: GAF domain-containing sensor histidine kinase [Anaerolineae bacterium]|nr:GAF domain-containing sensor histidine kinase [Anaerolineae bacterium]MDW8172243.1 GAF domain-containing sensor histidine kinase [Anaerolineae bacterium]